MIGKLHAVRMSQNLSVRFSRASRVCVRKCALKGRNDPVAECLRRAILFRRPVRVHLINLIQKKFILMPLYEIGVLPLFRLGGL